MSLDHPVSVTHYKVGTDSKIFYRLYQNGGPSHSVDEVLWIVDDRVESKRQCRHYSPIVDCLTEELIAVLIYCVELIAIDVLHRYSPADAKFWNVCPVEVFLIDVLVNCLVILVRRNHLHPPDHYSAVLPLSDFYDFVVSHTIDCDIPSIAMSLPVGDFVFGCGQRCAVRVCFRISPSFANAFYLPSCLLKAQRRSRFHQNLLFVIELNFIATYNERSLWLNPHTQLNL